MDLKKRKQEIDAQAEQFRILWETVLRETCQSIVATVPSFQVGPSPITGHQGFTIKDPRSGATWGVAGRGEQLHLHRYQPPKADPRRPNFWHGPNVGTTTTDWWSDDSNPLADSLQAQRHLEHQIDKAFLDWYKALAR